jgi:hypothetical protein
LVSFGMLVVVSTVFVFEKLDGQFLELGVRNEYIYSIMKESKLGI